MKLLSIVIIMLFSPLCVSILNANNLYQWVDEEGVVHVSQQPPLEHSKDVRKIHGPKTILGSTRTEVIQMFKGWKRSYTYEDNIDSNAIKFQNSDLIVVIDFDKDKRAEGVSFLSMSGLDDLTGKRSYVNENYEKLLDLATGGERTKIQHNKSTPYPVEVYIGNIHEGTLGTSYNPSVKHKVCVFNKQINSIR